jgi:hypothetical protein
VKQLEADLCLELCDLTAQRGLSNLGGGCRAGEAAALDNLAEMSELAEAHEMRT